MTDHTDPQRRTMLRNTVAAAAVLGSAHAAGAATAPPALDKPLKPTLTAFESQAGPKPLAFDPAKLNGLSEKIIRSHWENNYGGPVKALAVIKKRLSQALADKDLPPCADHDHFAGIGADDAGGRSDGPSLSPPRPVDWLSVADGQHRLCLCALWRCSRHALLAPAAHRFHWHAQPQFWRCECVPAFRTRA